MSRVFICNQTEQSTDLPAGYPLAVFLQQRLQLKGTRMACGEGDCGACQVLLGRLTEQGMHYQTVNACIVPLAAVEGCHVVTIEGLNQEDLSPVQRLLVESNAVQCGFCSPGLVIAMTGYLLNHTVFNESEAMQAVAGNLCRCTGYGGIRRAIRALPSIMADESDEPCLQYRVPDYFSSIAERLQKIPKSNHCAIEYQTQIIGGATDLMVRKAVTDNAGILPSCTDRNAVIYQPPKWFILASTTLEQFRNSRLTEFIPDLHADMEQICSLPVRHRATIGGNIVNASPIADLAVWLLALNAQLTLTDGGVERQVGLKDFYTAYKTTVLKPHERLVSVTFDWHENQQYSFEKVSKRKHLDIASVNSAFSVRVNHGHIETIGWSAGGVAPYPLYLETACAFMTGKPLTTQTLSEGIHLGLQAIAPIFDIRGSADYKRRLFKQLFYAHWLKLYPDLVTREVMNVD